MKLEIEYILILTESEKIALKKILGKLTDVEKKQRGLSEKECTITSNIWNLLPHEDGE